MNFRTLSMAGGGTLSRSDKHERPLFRFAVNRNDTVDALYQYIELSKLLEVVFTRLRTGHGIDGLIFQLPGWSHSIGNNRLQADTQCIELRLTYGAKILGLFRLFRHAGFRPAELPLISSAINNMGGPISNAVAHTEACHCAYRDSVTGLDNRAALDAMFLAKSDQRPTVLMVCDVDRFKKINDTYGHSVGDKVLRAFADELKSVSTDADTVFRFGGDEFVVALSNTDIDTGRQAAEKIRSAIADKEIRIANHSISVTTTIGVTSVGTSEPIEQAFVRADNALIKGKKEGSNRVVPS